MVKNDLATLMEGEMRKNKQSYFAAKNLIKKLIDYGHGDTLLDHRERDGLHQETIYIVAEAMEKFAVKNCKDK